MIERAEIRASDEAARQGVGTRSGRISGHPSLPPPPKKNARHRASLAIPRIEAKMQIGPDLPS
ncbi:MAG: hypothetical protein WAL80_00620, partial [Xanthobacteraceae bacterium]